MFAEVFSYDQELIDSGIEKGIEQGEQLQKKVFKMLRDQKSAEEIKLKTGISDEKLSRYQADYEDLFSDR